ncbi:MAG: hypothetical protein GY838_12985 [bacterium]|nr:hypothetical protein [bacterium]
MKITAAEFNERYPIGTPVTYYPVLPVMDDFPPVKSWTRTPAWELGHGAPVVSIEGKTGGMYLEHIELRKDDFPRQEPRRFDALDKITADREAAESIRCPHCGKTQSWDNSDRGDLGLVTYHGDDGPVEVECEACEKEFAVREDVERTYEAARTVGELE